jgi:hypothetical protein
MAILLFACGLYVTLASIFGWPPLTESTAELMVHTEPVKPIEDPKKDQSKTLSEVFTRDGEPQGEWK